MRKADCYREITNKLANTLLPPDASNVETAYHAFCSLTIKAVKQCVPLGKRKVYTPCLDKECEALVHTTQASSGSATALAANTLIEKLGLHNGKRQSKTSISCTQVTKHKEPLID